jgi:redox-sensitive bicupin YhaK (pirin superfamily)
MITVRPANERGHTQIGWLDSYHSFSFDQYYDPRFMGFRHLRVLNEDWVQPRQGFPTHPHRDMEIITVVLEGALEHRDSMGNGSVIRPGEVQRMSAGTGITHSEYNASDSEPVHLLQIWILPEEKRLQPSYEQREFKRQEERGRFRLVASNNPHNGAVKIHQNVELFVAQLDRGGEATHQLAPFRHAWVQVARGSAKLNGHSLKAGDGAAVSGEERLEIHAEETSELLLFDLA